MLLLTFGFSLPSFCFFPVDFFFLSSDERKKLQFNCFSRWCLLLYSMSNKLFFSVISCSEFAYPQDNSTWKEENGELLVRLGCTSWPKNQQIFPQIMRSLRIHLIDNSYRMAFWGILSPNYSRLCSHGDAFLLCLTFIDKFESWF